MDFGALIKPVSFGKPGSAGAIGVPRPLITGQTSNRRTAALREAGDVLEHLPGPGESLHALMTGRYDLTDTFEVLFSKLGAVDHLRIATLSFNVHNVTLIRDWLETGTVKRLTILYSLFFREHTPEVVTALAQVLEGRPGHRTAASRNHCKVTTFEFTSGRRLSLEGSANLRTNSNQEQFALIDGAELCAWHSRWIDEQVARHEVKQG